MGHPTMFILMTKHGLNVTEESRVKKAALRVNFVATYPTGHLSAREIRETCYRLRMLLSPIMLIIILMLGNTIIQLNIALDRTMLEICVLVVEVLMFLRNIIMTSQK